MLEVKHLRKEYKSKKGVVTKALDDVSLNFPETGMVFILGKSGSGKSTLLNVCGGLDKADSGEIVIKGKSSNEFSGQDFDSYRNTYVGFVFQEYNILDEFSVEENIALALELQNKKRDKEVIEKILADVDMTEFASRKPNTLSGGQKQRVAIARALVKEPEIIMADEPTGALDSKTGQQVFDTLKKLSEKKLVIVISHDRDFAEQYGDRIIELKDGKIISDQTRATEGEGAKNVRYFGTDTVCVNNGAEITDEDLQNIKKFLNRAGGAAVISTSREQIAQMKEDKPEMAVGAFENIKAQPEPKQYEKQKLIRSHLPARHAIKMGASSLKSKPVRLVFTIFLSIIAFILFGLASTLMLFDGKAITVQTFVDASDKYILLSKGYYGRYTSYNGNEIEWQDDNDTKQSTTFTLDEYEAIAAKYSGTIAVGKIYGRIDNIRLGQYGDQFYSETARNVILVNDVAVFADGNGRKPEAVDEIAISDYIYNGIAAEKTKFTSDNGKEVEISSPADILYSDTNKITIGINGKQYKVVGIYKIEEIDSKFDELKKAADEDVPFSGDINLTNEWTKYVESSLLQSIMVTADLMKAVASSSSGSNFYTGDYFDYISPSFSVNLEESIWYDGYGSAAKYGADSDKKLLDVYDLSGNKLSSLPANSVAISIDRLGAIYYSAYQKYIQDIENDPEERDRRSEARNAAYQEFTELYMHNEKYFNEDYYNEDLNNWQSNFENQKEYSEQNGWEFDEDEYRQNNPPPSKDDGYQDGNGIKIYKYYANSLFYSDRESYAERKADEASSFSEYYAIINAAEQRITDEYKAENPEPQQPSYDATQAEWDAYYEVYNEWYNGLWRLLDKEMLEVDPLRQLNNLSNSELAKDDALAVFARAKQLIGDIDPEIGIANEYHEFASVTVAGVFIEYRASSCAYVSDDLYPTYCVKSSYSSWRSEYVTKYVIPDDAFISTVYIPYEHTTSAVEELVELTYQRNADDSTAIIGNSQMMQLSMFIELAETLGTAFLIAGLVLALFAFLLMFNFISASITAKKKEIGILRAIGARTLDVYKIFMSEAFIIALICFIISSAGTFGLCILLNNIMTQGTFIVISIFSFGPLSVLCILGVALLTAIISTVIPVALYSRKPPIASIRAL